MTPEPVDVIGRALLRDVPPHQLTQIMLDEAWADARAALDAITAAGWVVERVPTTDEVTAAWMAILARHRSQQQPETD